MLILQNNWDVISLEINCEKWSGQYLFKQIYGKNINITGVIPKSLPVLSTESVLRKAAVDRG